MDLRVSSEFMESLGVSLWDKEIELIGGDSECGFRNKMICGLICKRFILK